MNRGDVYCLMFLLHFIVINKIIWFARYTNIDFFHFVHTNWKSYVSEANNCCKLIFNLSVHLSLKNHNG